LPPVQFRMESAFELFDQFCFPTGTILTVSA